MERDEGTDFQATQEDVHKVTKKRIWLSMMHMRKVKLV